MPIAAGFDRSSAKESLYLRNGGCCAVFLRHTFSPRRGAWHDLCTLRKADCLLELVALQLARRYWVARYAEAFHLMRPEELVPCERQYDRSPSCAARRVSCAVAAMMDNELGPREQPLMGLLFDDEEIVGQLHIVGRAGPPWIQKHAEPLRSVYEGIQHRFPVESDRAAESQVDWRFAFVQKCFKRSRRYPWLGGRQPLPVQ